MLFDCNALYQIRVDWAITIIGTQRCCILGRAVSRIREKGYKIHCGRWLVDGNPQVVLFDVGATAHKLDQYKSELYDKAGIGIPHEDKETNDVCIFG